MYLAVPNPTGYPLVNGGGVRLGPAGWERRLPPELRLRSLPSPWGRSRDDRRADHHPNEHRSLSRDVDPSHGCRGTLLSRAIAPRGQQPTGAGDGCEKSLTALTPGFVDR